MKPEIRKIVTRSALFFGILAVSAAGMQLAAWHNAQNASDAVTASAAQSPVIVLDAGHEESTEPKLQNARSVSRGAAVFIVDSFVLISSFFTA